MNWFWLKSQERKREAMRHSVTVTEQAGVAEPPVPDAEVRAAEDERRMQIVRDCIEYGRRHYAALPTGSSSPAPGPCPKCTKVGINVRMKVMPDAHSDECDWLYPLTPPSYGGGRAGQHVPVEREYLRVTCSTCGHDRGLVLPADAEVNQ